MVQTGWAIRASQRGGARSAGGIRAKRGSEVARAWQGFLCGEHWQLAQVAPEVGSREAAPAAEVLAWQGILGGDWSVTARVGRQGL